MQKQGDVLERCAMRNHAEQHSLETLMCLASKLSKAIYVSQLRLYSLYMLVNP